MLEIRKPDGKRQVYQQSLDKLRIMFDLAYTEQDFDRLKLYNLNHDQMLALLKSRNFREKAQTSKLVDCLVHLQKTRQLKLYKERQEIADCVHMLM